MTHMNKYTLKQCIKAMYVLTTYVYMYALK